MKDEFTIVMTAEPDPAAVQVVREGLDAFNAARGAPVDWQPLGTFVRDTEGAVVGGLTGGTYWGWLYIGRLWIEERLRGQGIGTRVLIQAEQEALRRGCHAAYLDTQDFHALTFYEKRGYNVYGELHDIPRMHIRYSMQKKLEEG